MTSNIKSNINTGPRNFIRRLTNCLDKMRLPPYRIVIPADVDMVSGLNEVIVARFDGLFMYSFTPACFYNYIRQTRFSKLPQAEWLESSCNKSSIFINKLLSRLLNRRDLRLRKLANAFVFQSKLSVDQHNFIHGEVPSNRFCKVINNGVPLEIFHVCAVNERFIGSPRIAICANFRLGKRLRDAVLIINKLRNIYKNATLHVFGDIDCLVRDSLKDLDLSSCVFHGAIPSDRLPSVYSSFDVGISPALFDACPNSVIEMLACGLPVITTSASGAAELVPDHRFIVPENLELTFMQMHNFRSIPSVDHVAWVYKIDNALQNRVELSRVSVAFSNDNFDINLIANRYRDLILEVWDSNA